MRKFVEITFKKKSNKPIAHYHHPIRRALIKTQVSMWKNHGIYLLEWKFDKDVLLLQLDIPSAYCNPFNPGKRLRGITNFLLKEYPDIFKPLRDGHQLFSYTDVT